MRIRPTHPLNWIAELIEDDSTFARRKMFGCEALYLHGRMMLVLADGEEPWNGLLLCTSREHHAALARELPALKAHAVLGKWLYVSQGDEAFESTASKLAELARRDDPRIGIVPGTRKKKRATATRTSRRSSGRPTRRTSRD